MVNYSTMPSVGRVAIMAASFLGAANAHMHMAEPKPIQGYSPKDPLEPDGSNFPCHGAPLTSSSGGQKIAAGEDFEVKWDLGDGANTAVHGGGSCQLAITYETDSTKAADPSNWHVIYSIEGGCPSNTKGNLNSAKACTSDDEADCVHEWDIPMPEGVESGSAILSLTWFNTVGNREMYQSCANIEITGGSGNDMGSFPPLFVANIGEKSNNCPTTESEAVAFPNPGSAKTQMQDDFYELAMPTGEGCGGSGGSAPKPTGYDSGSDSGSGSSEAAPSSYPAAPSATAAPSYGAPGKSAPAYGAPEASSQIQHSYTQQKGKQEATTLATSASTTAAPVSSVAPSSAAPEPTGYSSDSGAESNATSSADCEPCDDDGALICIGDDSFGICDHDCAVPRALSAGTVCTDGVIASAKKMKARFARRHAHFGGAHKH